MGIMEGIVTIVFGVLITLIILVVIAVKYGNKK